MGTSLSESRYRRLQRVISMDTSPRSWLDKLLGMAIVLAVSAWLIRWAVAVLTPMVPLFIILGLVAGGVWVGTGIVKRRRYS